MSVPDRRPSVCLCRSKPGCTLIDVADRIAGSILDAGRGTGENALYFAAGGTVSRASTSCPAPLMGRREEGRRAGPEGDLLVLDALALNPRSSTRRSTAGCSTSDQDRRRRRGFGVGPAGRPAASVSDERGRRGPRRVSRGRSNSPSPRAGRSSPSSIPVRGPHRTWDIRFRKGSPKAWFSVGRLRHPGARPARKMPTEKVARMQEGGLICIRDPTPADEAPPATCTSPDRRETDAALARNRHDGVTVGYPGPHQVEPGPAERAGRADVAVRPLVAGRSPRRGRRRGSRDSARPPSRPGRPAPRSA